MSLNNQRFIGVLCAGINVEEMDSVNIYGHRQYA